MKKFALLGSNIQKSLSPKIYQILADELNLEMSYELRESNHIFRELPNSLDGFNVTSPFKGEFYKSYSQFITQSDHISAQTQQANTYLSNDKNLKAFNTDYYGIEETLKERSIDLKDKTVYILGASQVTKSLVVFLNNQKVEKVKIFNRTIKTDYGLETHSFNEIDENFNFLINTIPNSYIPKTVLDFNYKDKYTFDLSYHIKNSSILKLNAKHSFNGLSMLIWQAIKNIEIWFNIQIHDKKSIKNIIYEKLK